MATLKEIAQRAHVSIGTVDRVIHNRGYVSKQNERIIRKIIEDLDYKPNLYAQQLQKNKKFVFGALMPRSTPHLEYWPIAIHGIEKARRELRKNNVQVQYFHYNANSRNSFVNVSQKILEIQPDGLLIAPGLYLDIIQQFTSRIKNHIPCVFFDSPVPETHSLCNIYQDAYESGWLSGKLMHLLLPYPCPIAIITVSQKGNHLRNRAEGFIGYFKDKPEYTLFTYCPKKITSPMHDIDKVTESIFKKTPHVKGIFTTNALVYKVAQYLNGDQQPGKRIALIGYDLTSKNIPCLRQGKVDFLISQKPEIQSYRGIYALYRHVALREPVESTVRMPLDIVTKENLDFYLEM